MAKFHNEFRENILEYDSQLKEISFGDFINNDGF